MKLNSLLICIVLIGISLLFLMAVAPTANTAIAIIEGEPVTVSALDAGNGDSPLEFNARYIHLKLLFLNISPTLHAESGQTMTIKCRPPLNNRDDVIRCLDGLDFTVHHPAGKAWKGGTIINIDHTLKGWHVTLRRFSGPLNFQVPIEDLPTPTPLPPLDRLTG